jgi:protocatechuate 3,4-dioxygenase alpha subunit
LGSDPKAHRAFTPEATVGPFYPGVFVADMPQDLWNVAPLVSHHPQGQPIAVVARFVDSMQRPVPSLVVEFWQANAHGRYRHPDDRSAAPLDPQFDGFARLRTSDNGELRFRTVKPGAHAVPNGSGVVRAPHLRLTIFASGIDRLATQLFFADEPLNDSDPILQSLADPLRDRLIAKPRTGVGADTAREYEIEIRLRGDGETPFFDDRDAR